MKELKFETLVYSIIKENGVYVIKKYLTYLVSENNQVVRKYKLVEEELAYNLLKSIIELKAQGYISVNKFLNNISQNVNPDLEAYVYDISKENETYKITKYVSYLTRENKETVRKFKLLGEEYTLDLPKRIFELKSAGYISANKFYKGDFASVVPYKYIANIKLLNLAYRNKLISKVYDEVIINGINYLITYISYINMETGIEYCESMGIAGIYNEETIAKLTANGYQYIGQTDLMNHINELNIKKRIALNVSQEKTKTR